MGKIDNIYSVWPEWETVEKIGEGSYGKVYKIRNTRIWEWIISP